MADNPLTLLRRVENLEVAAGDFGHAGHVGAAWASLNDSGTGPGSERYCRAIKALATHHGVPGHYHHTLTIALLHLIHARMRQCAKQDWHEFRRDNPDLFGDVRPLLAIHYSDELLRNDQSRRAFVPPDREPLPPMEPLANAPGTDSRRSASTL